MDWRQYDDGEDMRSSNNSFPPRAATTIPLQQNEPAHSLLRRLAALSAHSPLSLHSHFGTAHCCILTPIVILLSFASVPNSAQAAGISLSYSHLTGS
jgi:hypothetical protein